LDGQAKDKFLIHQKSINNGKAPKLLKLLRKKGFLKL